MMLLDALEGWGSITYRLSARVLPFSPSALTDVFCDVDALPVELHFG
jgi:hypothetical protein